MADTDDDDDNITSPPADWASTTPDQSWKVLAKTREKARALRAEVKAATSRIAELEAASAGAKTAAARVAELEAQTARLTSRLGMARVGVVDDEVAEIAEQRHARYAATAGKDALPLDQWLSTAAKEDRILAPLLAQSAAPPPTATQPAAPAKAPVVPSPTPQPTASPTMSADDIRRVRAANGGRLPAEVQKQVGTMIDVGDLLGRR